MNPIGVALSMWLCVAAAGFVAFSGCQGCKSPAQSAYVVGQTTTITVEAAMGLWSQYVSEKHPGPAVEQKVKNAYDNYRKADTLLLQTGKALLADSSTTNSTAWSQAAAGLTASANDLFALLTSLGVKLPTK